jgi:hypothetical protein
MNTIQMTLDIEIAGGDNWQERLADALLATQAIVRDNETLPTSDTLDGNTFTASYTLFGELKLTTTQFKQKSLLQASHVPP